MARKVFISFLGTNNYVECIYNYKGMNSEPVRFVQEALIKHTCNNWTEEDKIIIFCTSKASTGEIGSKELNWYDNGHDKLYCEIEKIGLENRLIDLKAKTKIKAEIQEIDIKSGFTENEIWDIFNTIYKQLRTGDEIYLDVTHAFRSIPLFSIVLFNYSKFLLGAHLVSVVYGAFEKLGPAYKVRTMKMEQRIVSVIDLMNIICLQEYTQIASGLNEFGKIRNLTDVICSTDEVDNVLKQLALSIRNIDDYIATIDLKKIKEGKYIASFRNNYKNVIKKEAVIDPIANILKRLNDEIADFEPINSLKNIEVAINWTIKHDMLMQTYPLAEEYIIMYLADLYVEYKPENMKSKVFREFVGSILGMPESDFESRNWQYKLAEFPQSAEAIAEKEIIKDIRPKYDEIRRARNSLAHGNGSLSYADLKSKLNIVLDCIGYLNPCYFDYPSTRYIQETMISE